MYNYNYIYIHVHSCFFVGTQNMHTVYERPAFSNGGASGLINQGRPWIFQSSGRTQAVQKRPWLLQKAGMNRFLAQKLWVDSGFRSVDSVCLSSVFFVVASKMYGSISNNGRSGVIRFMYDIIYYLPRWWFQTFLLSSPIWGRCPFWLYNILSQGLVQPPSSSYFEEGWMPNTTVLPPFLGWFWLLGPWGSFWIVKTGENGFATRHHAIPISLVFFITHWFCSTVDGSQINMVNILLYIYKIFSNTMEYWVECWTFVFLIWPVSLSVRVASSLCDPRLGPRLWRKQPTPINLPK